MDLCEICKSIRFDELPSEEEPGTPHLPDLDSLSKSAKDCCLCRVILLAASELSTIIKNERTGGKGNPGGEVEFQQVYTMYFGYHGHDDDGVHSGGSLNYAGPVYTNPQHVFPRDNSIRPWLFGSWWTLGTPQSPLQLIGFGVRLGTGPKIEDAVGNSGDRLCLRGTSFRFRTEHCSPLAQIIPGRLRATSSSSSIAFKKVQQWLKECDEHHLCAPYEAALPTRVLDLGESTHSQLITLVETKGQIQKYVALSHCWGLSHRIKTMKDTIEAHKKGILFSVLPKTFRDAIVASRKLGIRYLWIDTLCIIQDDMQDWELESSKMGEVYANAYITIAASSSTDDSSGLFPSMEARIDENGVGYFSSDTMSHGRPGLANAIPDIHFEEGTDHPTSTALSDSALVTFETAAGKSKLFLTPEWMPSSRKEDPLTYRIGEFGRSFDPLNSEPLSSRGWTLQERLLSPRILHYGTNQMYWECRECLLAEDGAYFKPNYGKLPSFIELPLQKPNLDALTNLKISEDILLSCSEEITSTSAWNQPWWYAWTRLIKGYTRRELTRDQDKLPALAGLAKTISANSGDIYLAGLWRGSILQTLGWQVSVYEPNHMCDDPEHSTFLPLPTKPKVQSPASYRAPSWSWAAIDAEIDFKYSLEKFMAKVIDCQVIPANSDPFGRVQSGWIKIFAPLLQLRRTPDEHIYDHKSPHRVAVSIEIENEVIEGKALFDLEPEFPCFALILSNDCAIVLKQQEEDNSYIRIGSVGWQIFGYNGGRLIEVPYEEEIPYIITSLDSSSTLDIDIGPSYWSTVTII